MIFRDVLYGKIQIRDELVPFLKLPEFVRLRGVRLSNVDSFEFKDLNGPTRWDHALGVVHLAEICATSANMDLKDRMQLCLAALLHDIATPPYAHTAEYVLADFDHELETSRLLSGKHSIDVAPDATIYLSEIPQFGKYCAALSKLTGVKIDSDEVAQMVVGEGKFGYLISGTLDLDNADNVTRAAHFMGHQVDRRLPERLARFLGTCKSAPLDLEDHPLLDVKNWVEYRAWMYGAFFSASPQERGREAFLQHLFRRAIDADVPRRQLIWNTDDGLLNLISSWCPPGSTGPELKDLVRRYRLLEDPYLVLTLPIENLDDLRVLKLARAASWIERQLTTEYCESIVSVTARRFGSDDSDGALLPSAVGQLQFFKLSAGLSFKVLPDWLKERIGRPLSGARLTNAIRAALRLELQMWVRDRPWLDSTPKTTERVRARLEGMGDWSFRQTRNLTLHTYPSTFVHAIPASLIHALGIAGELVLDPFGGTGNTALEAVKAGGTGITNDSNWIASQIATVRTSYLAVEKRQFLRSISRYDLEGADVSEPAAMERLAKWHHPRTYQQLARIKGFVEGINDEATRRYLTICFSAILPGVTARRGEQHGFFADNTPLPRGANVPPFVDAFDAYVDRVQRNLIALETSFAVLEKEGSEAEVELKRARVVQGDIRTVTLAELGVSQGEVSAIITSPPYLCMTDYTLGHRLSYYWLAPERMDRDFLLEIGARRLRLRGLPEDTLERYVEGMTSFLRRSNALLRSGGYLAMVLGAPVARAFSDKDVLGRIDKAASDIGFEPVWSAWRSISWSRNHSYKRLERERISVHRVP